MSPHPTSLGPRTQGRARALRPPAEGRHRWARAYRDGRLVCGRVELTVRADLRLGLAPRERRRLTARFLEHLDPALRSDLTELVRRRGAAGQRAAERMQPVEVVFDDHCAGWQRIVARVQPPQLRRSELHQIEFDLREPTP